MMMYSICRRRSRKSSSRSSKQPKKTQTPLPFASNPNDKSVCVDGRRFGSEALTALCEVVEEEQDENIDWYNVAKKLEAREVSYDALLTLRRAATRLEDEARASKANERATKSRSRRVVQNDLFLGRRAALRQKQTLYDDGEDGWQRWSPKRCKVLWKWVAYAREPPESTTNLDDDSSDDDEDVLDPWEFAYRAQRWNSQKKRYLSESLETLPVRSLVASEEDVVKKRSYSEDGIVLEHNRPRLESDSSRLEDLTAAAMLCDDDDDDDDDAKPNLGDKEEEEAAPQDHLQSDNMNFEERTKDNNISSLTTTTTAVLSPQVPPMQAGLAAMLADQARQGRHFQAVGQASILRNNHFQTSAPHDPPQFHLVKGPGVAPPFHN